MDGTTEPIIAVLGHPIAGNPSQFAIERALEAQDLDWRVLSFDVHPHHIAAALEGFKVTGIAGVMIDPSVMSEAAAWHANKTESDLAGIDCLYRDEELMFKASYEQKQWLETRIDRHPVVQRLWIGRPFDNDLNRQRVISTSNFDVADVHAYASAQSISQSQLIVVADDDDPVELDLDDWGQDDGTTLVIDLSGCHPDIDQIARRGYQVVTAHQRRVGMLDQCLERWTRFTSTPYASSVDVISEAIEEYLGV
ncbi:hypothetical protein K227x_19760 [Rubripirellula lacrimiformis]|uniref:Uncharacterized protein n=1 Tax=Rubripirellula lacrimiformis TaxID=1930273 RepID=A0A517N8Z2_9BACT|nr:hypothetical protein [Rubripirellula lacrimiformis]QDT03592.1 hypothetical protein K227x_19760 [Rubripirellula lacrimiformis]